MEKDELDQALEAIPEPDSGEPEGEKVETDEVQSEEISEAKAEDKPEEQAEPEPETTSEPDKQAGFMKAMLDEREKRQKAQQERDEALKKLEESKQEPVDFLDDPDGSMKNFENKLTKKFDDRFLRATEALVKAQFPDYDEVSKVGEKLITENPVLLAQVQKADNPILEVYQLGIKQQKLDEIGDPDKFRERVKAEALAEAKALLEAEQKTDTKKTVPTLSDVTPTGGDKVAPFDPAEEIGVDAMSRARR